jgi:hypothetical protein
LQQRKRWMAGAMQLPWFQRVFVFAEALFMPLVILLCFVKPLLGLFLLTARAALIVGEVYLALRRLDQPARFRDVWPYLPYHFVIGMANMVYYLLPVPVQWKGRKY